MNIKKPRSLRSEDLAHYNAQVTHEEDAIIEKAIAILHARLRKSGDAMSTPDAVRNFLKLNIATLEHEVFVCIFLDCQNQFICYEEMFRGTLTQTSVYPREVIKAAIKHNAAGVILAHNHPSGVCEPSRADDALTQELKRALALIDVRVLDHFIVAGASNPLSFAERGLL